MKIEDLIAELVVFPLNNKVQIKLDGKLKYITAVKIKDDYSDDVVVVEVV